MVRLKLEKQPPKGSFNNGVLKKFPIFTCGLQACNFVKETPAQVFSCEYCEIFKNTYFEEHLWTAASIQ